MHRKWQKAFPCLLASLILSLISTARGAVTPGSTIEVREGDTWSKATVIRTEGNDVRVRYDDGSEEVVEPERLRSQESRTALATKQTDESAPPLTDAGSPKPGAKIFSVGEAVEIKRDGKWIPAHVGEVSPNWVFVTEDRNQDQRRWAEPWVVRVAGSDYDVESSGTSIWPSHPGEIAPNEKPKQAPASMGDPFVIAPPGEHSVSREDLEKKFDELSFDHFHEPATGEDKSLNITATHSTGEFSAWGLHGTENGLGAILPCLDNDKTAVASYPGSFGKWTAVIRINLAGHSQLDVRSLHISDLRVIAACDDGNLLLTTFRGDANLQVWKWAERKYGLVANLRLQSGEFDRITSAWLLGHDKALIAAANGEVYLIDPAAKEVISSVKTAPNAKIFVHPSGQVIGVITSSSTALLLRPDFSIVAEYTDAGNTGNITVDPTGRYVAYLTNTGVVRVRKISDGSQLGQLCVGASFSGRLDLVDDKFLLVDHSVAYEVKSGIPVWLYKIPNYASLAPLPTGQFLIAVPGNKRTGVALISIPDHVGRAALKSATRDRFMLVPGMAIKIDFDFTAFGDQKQKAEETIHELLQSAGMKVTDDSGEPFDLALSIAPGPTETRDYAPDIFAGPNRTITTVQVPSNILTATLTHKGEAVWTQQVRFGAGGVIQKDATHSFQDSANEAAKPHAEAIKSLNFPNYLPIGAKPGTPAALGSSTLQDRRFVPDTPPNGKQAIHT